MNIPRTLSLTKRQLIFGAIALSGLVAVTVSIGAGCAFAFCGYVVLTA